jgi:hypothetical protein
MSVNSKEEASRPYLGSLIFTNQTLSFDGTTIQLRNVTRFSTHEVKRTHKISPALLGSSILIFFLSLSWKGLGFISFISAAIAGYGIYEYFQPKLFALVIELNSSYHHIFSSVDRTGIQEVYKRINSAMTSDKPVNTTVIFKNDQITFGDHISGDKYEFNEATINNAGSFNNNPERPL